MLPVEDYLEARPERRPDLERLVRAGRLFLGPWYALADEYLVSPEALIRNLSLGMRLAREFGPIMSEGYVPDAFGHIAQLPQILQGFVVGSARRLPRPGPPSAGWLSQRRQPGLPDALGRSQRDGV
jgi:alpha-mannosidase